MSDVSGIPYMGPMGQGNFFAPSFSYNPQMSAGQIQSTYMPEFAQGQGVLNNLYASGGGFGQQTNYYSGLGAQYSAMGQSPYGIFSNSGGDGGGGGGGGASPYQTSSSVWDTGASPFQGGGGFDGGLSGGWGGASSSPYQSLSNVFSSGASPFNYGGAGLDWSNLYQPQQQQSPFSAGNLGAGMFGGLTGSSGAYQGPSNQIDWGGLFSGGGGGARADPAPGMTMPGGLNSPMTTPQQSALDWTGGGARADPAPGMAMPGGLNSPMTTQQAQPDFNTLFEQRAGGLGTSPFELGAAPMTGAQDTGPYGGGAGIGGLDTGRAIGEPYTRAAEPQRGMLQEPVTEAYNPYYGVTSPYEPLQAQGLTDTRTALAPGGGLTATDLSEQARARLAEIMSGAKQPTPDEVFAGDTPVPTEGQPASDELAGEAGRAGMMGGAADPYDKLAEAVPLPRERPAGADAERPAFETGMQGRQQAIATLKKELEASNLIMTSGYRDPTDPLSRANPTSAHSQGRAFDVRAQTPGQADAAMGNIRELLGARGLVEGRDYRILDEVRSPSAWATGPHVHTQFTEAGMQKYQDNVYREPAEGPATTVYPGADAPRPPEDIPPASSVPLPVEHPAEAGESRVNQSQNISPPPADIPDPRVSGAGFNALDAAASPVKHSGLELARANIDTPIEKIAMERGGQKAVDQVSSMAVGMTPRQLAQSYGGLFMSRAEPLFQSLGITRQDFDKAMALPSTKQDLKMRFGGDFGGMGGELPSAGAFTPYEGFRQSPDFENRTGEQLGRNELARLRTQGAENVSLPEAASTPLGRALGLDALGGMGNVFDRVSTPSPTPVAPSTAGEYSIFDKSPGELNPYTGQAGPDPAFRYTSPYGYGGGIGTGFAEDQQVNQQKAEGELQFQRAPMVSQLEDNEGTRNKLFATMVDEMGTGASDQAYAAVAESLFNRAAAAGNFDELDKATFLGGRTKGEKYYEGQQGPGGKTDTTMGSKYLGKLDMVQRDPALQARLWEIVKQVAAGSNVSNFATDNASAGVARNALARLATQGESLTTRSPDYGKTEGESFFRKDNPMGTTGRNSAEDFIGKGPQDATRAWYQNLVPSMRYPPY